MLIVDSSLVRLGLSARDKHDAIRQTAAILAESGCVDPAYAQSMIAREAQTATFLGHGIAIPHGLRTDAAMIRRTAVAVAQFPSGVAWNPGETVYLAVGIAATSDEHISVLANLTDVLQDDAIAAALARTRDPQRILTALNQPRTPASPMSTAAPAREAGAGGALDPYAGYPAQVEIVMPGNVGLHARPAAALAAIARRFQADIRVRHGDKVASGKALASLLTLGVEAGARFHVLASGPDADAALRALRVAIEEGLGEHDAPPNEHAQPAPSHPTPALPFVGDVRLGVAASPGIAIALLHRLHRTAVAIGEATGNPAEEQAQLDAALDAARAQIRRLHGDVAARSGARKAAIFLAHGEMLDDPDLLAEARERIHAGASAASAFHTAAAARATALETLSDPLLAARADDIRDVADRVLRCLSFGSRSDDAAPTSTIPSRPVIILADDLSPSDTASLDAAWVKGLATAHGGPNAHTAILARALGIPAVVGLGDALLDLPDGTEAIIDGSGGVLVVSPGDDDRALAVTAAAAQVLATASARRDAYRPAVTRDGHRVEVVANIGTAADATRAVDAGAEGVGLLRTEFLFLKRDTPPTEDEQTEALLAMVRALNGLPLVVRTLDIGGDKDVPYLSLPREDNPFLGVRGVRLCLAQPELFNPQLRAIVRAAREAPEGAVKVMFPMVATIEELRDARAALERVRAELHGPPIDCGIMIEVPSAAVMADVFAREAAFLSIGTNDLTQYVLAMDRLHPALTRHADGLHPAVLRLIDQIVQAAHAHGRWVGVCGNLAAERAAAPILVGLGVDELSVSPPAVPELKAQVRDMSLESARALARRALACATAAEVRALS
ncbi:phosphoenolpyruvate--protein phosphotransferase [Chondromyces apiculatus]|uniref:phosphoenolpyruvate--protein phosphotransferase n=1 Tax=Chondromyces apiculatus DSM 436 TaxID=1192034 RepID=A0A017TAV1_9BACT|nr:phosphoenolpyruvate--protein phosphotransferase [Chondromyces apiculatus]EYF05950.1 Phosphoenolpyruvate-protein phosphotransferase of PTS system [Chondromyces apiculatus DSM 436]